jgi:hypothetical protein
MAPCLFPEALHLFAGSPPSATKQAAESVRRLQIGYLRKLGLVGPLDVPGETAKAGQKNWEQPDRRISRGVGVARTGRWERLHRLRGCDSRRCL